MHILESEWTLWVPAKPAVVLPSEVDVVISWVSPCYLGLAVLEADDQWLFHGENYTNAQMLEEINGHSITVLAPVAETAKKVLDAVDKGASVRSRSIELTDLAIQDIAAQFGVTDE